MIVGKKQKKISSIVPNRRRHESGCCICAHPQRAEIEQDFIAWKSPAKIAAEYKLRNRASVYRHAHAFDLFTLRARNLGAALDRIIERADDAPATAAAAESAIVIRARLNSVGQFLEGREQVSFHDLFARMTREGLEAYAKDGVLPKWFSDATGATPPEDEEDH